MPLILVLGIAVVGVLVEAFVGRNARYYVQVPLAFIGLAAAFAWTIGLGWSENPHHVAAEGALGVDGPTLFIQGTILVLALVSLLLIAERGGARADGAFAAQASALPGTEAEQRTAEAGVIQTEVFPLMMFAVGGMIMFPAANDLLTMFVALEVMSLPLYLLCGLAAGAACSPRRRRSSTSCSARSRRRSSSTASRCCTGTPGRCGCRRSPRRSAGTPAARRCSSRASRCCRWGCCSSSAASPSTCGSRTSTRAPPPRSRR